jgi:hypothetical protein
MFMGDYQNLPKDKVEAVRKAIGPVKKKQPDKPYYEIPMTYRLGLAEAAYKLMDKDDDFWCRFYRIKGYHFAAAGDRDQAKAARLKALALAEKLLEAGAKNPPAKELMLIIGSMQHFTGQKDKALQTLARVPKTKVEVTDKMTEEQARNATDYLDKVAGELLEMVRSGKKVPQ